MAAFNVTVLNNYGYNATALADPMTAEFRAKTFVSTEVSGRTGTFSNAKIIERIRFLADYKPYSQAESNQ